MQTRKVVHYGRFKKVSLKGEALFPLSEGKEVAAILDLYSDAPVTVYLQAVPGNVALAVDVYRFSLDQRLTGANAFIVRGEGELFVLCESRAIGIAPMDTTPMEITTQLPAPTMEEMIRREFNKRFPQRRNDDKPEIDDEVLERAGGADYTIDDDDPDDPLEVTAADIVGARKRKRPAADNRVQPVDDGSDPGEDPNRGGSGQSPAPTPAGAGD